MKQLIQELKLFLSDTLDLSPTQDSVIFKYILSNTLDFASGLKSFTAGDTSSYYAITNANYIFLVSDDLFQVVFEDESSGEEIILTTQQFSHVNLSNPFSLELQGYPTSDDDVIINYLHGTIVEED